MPAECHSWNTWTNCSTNRSFTDDVVLAMDTTREFFPCWSRLSLEDSPVGYGETIREDVTFHKSRRSEIVLIREGSFSWAA